MGICMSLISISGAAMSGKDTVGEIIQLLSIGCSHKDIRRMISSGMYDGNIADIWQIQMWSEKLKQIASLLTGVPREKWEDPEFKKSYMPSQWNKWGIYVNNELRIYENKEVAVGEYEYYSDRHDTTLPELVPITYRQFLEWLGTEGLRDGVHEDIHVNGLMSEYTPDCSSQDCLQNCGCTDPELFPNWIITGTRFFNELNAVKEKGGITVRIHNKEAEANEKSSHRSANEWKEWKFDYEIDNNSTIEELIVEVEKMLKLYLNN